jgi:hypothetical protein
MDEIAKDPAFARLEAAFISDSSSELAQAWIEISAYAKTSVESRRARRCSLTVERAIATIAQDEHAGTRRSIRAWE